MKKDATALELGFAPESLVDPTPLRLRVGTPQYRWWELRLKRIMDIIVSLAVLILGAPLYALLAVLVKTSSPGPILFRQMRLGLNGRPFEFYKFRSMRHGSDDTIHRNFAENFINGDDARDDTVFKMVDDPRVTRFGYFLRRSSLDELPQFMNVLRGEMSLVGPRPPISYELDHYQDWHRDRLKVKPGLTGLWQVSGRSQVGFDEMVMLDLHYISRWSLLLDLKLIARTIPVMLRGDGAY